jgi:M6 family metalloprotease-like protein
MYRIFIDTFAGSQAQALYYDADSHDWWLLGLGGQPAWSYVGNTWGFGNLLDGRHYIYVGSFSDSDLKSILFYHGRDSNWWLGTISNGALTWRGLGDTAGYGDLTDGAHLIWTGDFNGDGRDEIIMYHERDSNWWLGSIVNSRLTWSGIGNTAGFGPLIGNAHRFWVGNFTAYNQRQLLMHFSGDGNWWSGVMTDNRLQWSTIGNTRGFGNLLSGDHAIYCGQFGGDSCDDILFYYANDHTWWLGTYRSGRLEWRHVSTTSGFGNLLDGRHLIWTADFGGSGRESVLMYHARDSNWWVGEVSTDQITWRGGGNTAGYGDLLDGFHPIWVGRLTDRANVVFHHTRDGNWWRGALAGGTLSWSGAGNSVWSRGNGAVVPAPTLGNFGHGSLTQEGKLAVGKRPLLVILAEYSNFAPLSAMHPVQYYERIGFSAPTLPFSTANPVNPASLLDFFYENSNGRFAFEKHNNWGVLGPVAMGSLQTDPGPEERFARICRAANDKYPGAFFMMDVENDRVLSPKDLCILVVENITPYLPANRFNNPVTLTWQVGSGTRTISVQVHWAAAGPVTPFFQMAHELSHSIGAVDMYNTGTGNNLMTLMSGYSFTSNDQAIVHLDGWHKLGLGWSDPRRYPLEQGGNAMLREGEVGSVILWDAGRREREYFLVERRGRRFANRKYEENFPGDGALIWRVQPGQVNGVGTLAAPNLQFGGSGVWGPGQETPPLSWSNGQSANVKCRFRRAHDNAFELTWFRT